MKGKCRTVQDCPDFKDRVNCDSTTDDFTCTWKKGKCNTVQDCPDFKDRVGCEATTDDFNSCLWRKGKCITIEDCSEYTKREQCERSDDDLECEMKGGECIALSCAQYTKKGACLKMKNWPKNSAMKCRWNAVRDRQDYDGCEMEINEGCGMYTDARQCAKDDNCDWKGRVGLCLDA